MEAMTYKVLFADDEYWTREKIRRIIPWEKYALEFLEPASDGEEVLERLEKDQPDILITDINMPYLNGVELLKKVQELRPDLITFVISGYDDFAYVKDSFLAGSINYLMKPVEKIDLVNSLSRALEIIGERRERMEKEQEQQRALQRAASFIQDREFSQLLDMKTAPRGFYAPGNTRFAGASLLLLKIHSLQEFIQMYDYDMNLLSFSIKKRLREIAGREDILIFNHVYRANEFLMVTELPEEETQKLGRKILMDFSHAVTSPMTMIESEHCYSLDNLYEAYIQDISCMMLRTWGGGNVYVKASKEKNAQKGRITGRIGEGKQKEMQGLLSTGNLGAFQKLVMEEIGLGRCRQEGWTYLEVRQSVQKVVNYLIEQSADRLAVSTAADVQSFLEMADKAVDMMDEEHLREVLNEIMEFFFNIAQPEPADSIKTGIRQAVQYVEEHYQEALTLSFLAEKFHIESSYFSRMFRKETGENLMLYICRRRMEKAVEYMEDPGKNLTEIAFMVGYDDYTYFNKVFRKMMGKSPREYRNCIKKQGE